jgi:hypothetical protein
MQRCIPEVFYGLFPPCPKTSPPSVITSVHGPASPPVESKVNLSSPPRKRGSVSVDSRFRGNDVTFDSCTIRPRQSEIPRYAQTDNNPGWNANCRLTTGNCSSPPNRARGR